MVIIITRVIRHFMTFRYPAKVLSALSVSCKKRCMVPPKTDYEQAR